jgi:hypothetical protein
MGYPGWQALAEATYEEAARVRPTLDHDGYRKFLLQRKFASVFEQAEGDLGGRSQLIQLLKSKLQPSGDAAGGIYELILRWPFACYLTTNWDDEVSHHAKAVGIYTTVLRNGVQDFAQIRADARNLVVKIHGDLDHPNAAVITTSDYRRYTVEGAFDYFRKKLRSILELLDVVIIGHSLTDPDIQYVLQTARELGRPEHPIFMMAADVTEAERTEYLTQYNIAITSYRNEDGSHAGLRRLLATAGQFIRARSETVTVEHYDVPHEEIAAAAALFLYTRLTSIAAKAGENHSRLLEPLVLTALSSGTTAGLSRGEVEANPLLTPLLAALPGASTALTRAIEGLLKAGFVSTSGTKILVNKTGTAALRDIEAARALSEDQAYGHFRMQIEQEAGSLSEATGLQCVALMKEAVVGVFRRRGIAIANSVFANQPTSGDDLADIFAVLSDASAKLGSPEVAAAFMDSAHDFLIEPTTEQRSYLASISQGFFLYHLLGKDPTAAQIRRDIFRNTIWLIDSSVLIPFAAKGCHNHKYAVDLLQRLGGAAANFFATSALLREVLEHFDWARDFCAKHPVYSPEFLEAALARQNYKQNLFLDGFVRSAADGKVTSFTEYCRVLFPSGATHEAIKKNLISKGLKIVDLDQLQGFEQIDYGEQLGIEEAVRSHRKMRHSLRSDLQVKAEAEVFQMVRRLSTGTLKMQSASERPDRVYFVSQSKVLDNISPGAIITWSPESVYRYLTALPGASLDPELLQQCMLNDYYNAGISFIDKAKYEQFFLPYISAAKASFDEHKERYFSYVESASDVENSFANTVDIEKPLFVQQMVARIARTEAARANAAEARADAAEAQLRLLQMEKEAAWSVRAKVRKEQEEAERRNSLDPKHVRKRRKQAAQRAKKQKKRPPKR